MKRTRGGVVTARRTRRYLEAGRARNTLTQLNFTSLVFDKTSARGEQ